MDYQRNTADFESEYHEPTQLDQFVERLEPILRHVNAHRFLWSFTLVCTFVAWNRGLVLLYGMVAFLLAVLIVSHIFRIVNLRGISIDATFTHASEQNNHERSLASEIRAGEMVDVQVQTNVQWSKHFLHVQLPVLRVIPVHTSENLTHVLSTQLFIYTTKGNEYFSTTQSLPRGVYRLQSAHLQCAYPFGLLQSSKTLALNTITDTATKFTKNRQSADVLKQAQDISAEDWGDDGIDTDLYVLPNSFDITTLPMQTAQTKGQGHISSSQKGGFEEFTSLRGYRQGDALKTVHWGASAKQVSRGQSWVVKEYTTFDTPSLVIVLNQFDIINNAALDTMIATSLAVANYFISLGYQVDLFGYDGHSQSVSDFWHININTTNKSDQLRKLAEIAAIAEYVYTESSATKANKLDTDNQNSDAQLGMSSLFSRVNTDDYTPPLFSNAELKTADYHQSIQSVLAQHKNANVLLSFYNHSPTQSVTNTDINQQMTQYQVVVTRQKTTGHTYIKRGQYVHEFTLNALASVSDWQDTFNHSR